jgi:hypothetical protein
MNRCGITCDGCGARLVVEMLLPSEVWEQIADGDYALCPICMDERMALKGLRCEGVPFFRGKALTTRITTQIQRAVVGWRVSPAEVARSGSVGNPTMAEVFQDDEAGFDRHPP